MNTVKSLNELKNLNKKVYVRWSKSFELDKRRGYSLMCGTSAEAGISCCEIDPTWEDWRILRQLQEYRYIAGGQCWLITGTEVGRGGDNEPLLRDIELVAQVSETLTAADWQSMEKHQKVEKLQAKLANITDASAKEIIQKQLDSLLNK